MQIHSQLFTIACCNIDHDLKLEELEGLGIRQIYAVMLIDELNLKSILYMVFYDTHQLTSNDTLTNISPLTFHT